MHPLWCEEKAMLTCVYQVVPTLRAADKRDATCGLAATGYNRTHGYLCANHYRHQQNNIPAKPRKAQPQWRGLTPQRDDEIIADIIAKDRAAIAEGSVVTVTRGRQDPVKLRLLEPPTVH
jgi:hypothetical protein